MRQMIIAILKLLNHGIFRRQLLSKGFQLQLFQFGEVILLYLSTDDVEKDEHDGKENK